jgi:hypothetical protein
VAGGVGAGGRRSSNMRERAATAMHDARAGVPTASVQDAGGNGAGCGRRRRCGSGRRRRCRMWPAASVRDAGGDGDAAAMRGVGDGGSLPPEHALCSTPSSSSSGSRMEKGRGDASFYTPGHLVPVGNAIRD